MNFKPFYYIFLIVLATALSACSDPDNETDLVNLHLLANQDLISINFPASTETIVSTGSYIDLKLEGLKSNGVDTVTLSNDIEWSVSSGAVSTISQQGRLTASDQAEQITVTATYGFLSQSIDINVSSAKFAGIVSLNEESFDINMCQSKVLNPVGRYFDENNEEQIRPVDSKTINSIEWTVINSEAEDDTESKRAYIETVNDQPRLHSLSSGDIIIRAKVYAEYSAGDVIHEFDQTISKADVAGNNEIKLCLSDATNLSTCRENEFSVQKDEVISLIAVGKYQDSDGADYYENISHNSQWGIDNSVYATLAFSSDHQQIEVTGTIEEESTTISAACGNIVQSLDGVDISKGVILNELPGCATSGSTECQTASALLKITARTVTSFEVTVSNSPGEITLTDNVSSTLDSRPAEITLTVKVNYSNDEQEDITEDSELSYRIETVDDIEVIEKTNTDGVFKVLSTGTAKILLEYRGEEFIVLINVPF